VNVKWFKAAEQGDVRSCGGTRGRVRRAPGSAARAGRIRAIRLRLRQRRSP